MERSGAIHFIIACMGFLFFIPLTSCKKETISADDNRNTFVKVYASDWNEGGVTLDRTSSGNLFISNYKAEYDAFEIMVVDEFGHLIKSNKIEGLEDFYPQSAKMANGDLIINASWSSHIYRFNEAGEKLWGYEFEPVLSPAYKLSRALEGDDGNIYISFTDGTGSGAPSSNYVGVLEPDGDVLGYYYFDDSLFGPGKILQFYICNKVRDTMLIAGSKFIDNNWGWGDLKKFFIARITPNEVSTWVIDEDDNTESDYLNQYVTTSDGGAVVLTEGNYGSVTGEDLRSNSEVYRFDAQGQMVWRKRINLPAIGYHFYGLKETPDNGYLLSGYTYTSGSTLGKAVIVKLDKNGEIVLSRILDLGGSVKFYDGLQIPSGDFLFSGGTDVYGRGAQNSDAIIVRTDRDGNWKKE